MYTRGKILATSALCAFFIIYPNILWIPWNLMDIEANDKVKFWASFVFRSSFFFILFVVQISSNEKLLDDNRFVGRFFKNLLFTVVGGLIFLGISYMVTVIGIQSGTIAKHLTFQFLVVSLLCTFIGYVSQINNSRQRKELEVDQLKVENLKARCDAIASRINPHFFFNSLGGISALVQRGDEEVTLDYISRLSDLFRYTLRSDISQLVPLKEELDFARSFAFVMDVRFGGKLSFNIDVPEEYLSYQLPTLSLLPLLENVATHNRIDSFHLIRAEIYIEDCQIIVCNNTSSKLTPPDTSGSGLDNLDRRFLSLIGKGIGIEAEGNKFTVRLPLKN